MKTAEYSSPKGEIKTVTLTNGRGASVTLSTLGAGITSVIVPDAAGKFADVCMGYAKPSDYLYDGPNAGKTLGRYANRISEGRFVLDERPYRLPINLPPSHLHGGPEGFQNQIWTIESVDDKRVVMTLHSPDGQMGYPGNVDARVTYTWDDDNRLTIDYEAVTDAPTVINMANHAYWNLDGHDSGTVLLHTLQLNASRWLETDRDLVPTGVILGVAETPMDFTYEKALGEDMDADYPPLKWAKGYDHCWLIDNLEGDVAEAARLRSDKSGRVMTVFTNQPAVQVYTGNWLADSPAGKDGAVYHDYDCVAIECEGCPDAPNRPEFPSQRLNPGETYRRTTVYQFTAEEPLK